MSRTSDGNIWGGFRNPGKKLCDATGRITCNSRLIEPEKLGSDEAYCAEHPAQRCVDVPTNICRMKPVNSVTGKKLRRKFVVKKENVKAEWWKEDEH